MQKIEDFKSISNFIYSVITYKILYVFCLHNNFLRKTILFAKTFFCGWFKPQTKIWYMVKGMSMFQWYQSGYRSTHEGQEDTQNNVAVQKKRENETMECQTHVMMQTFNDDFFHWKNESFILNKHYYHPHHHRQLVILEADVSANSTSRVRFSSAGHHHHHQRHNPSHDQIIFCLLSI